MILRKDSGSKLQIIPGRERPVGGLGPVEKSKRPKPAAAETLMDRAVPPPLHPLSSLPLTMSFRGSSMK